MDILEKILTLSIGGTTIGFIIVYLGKFFLEKSSEVIIENHKNQLEILKTEHQIKFSKLHEERAEIIKIIYHDFFELENKLEYLTTLFQGPEWINEKSRDEDAIKKYRETFERIEKNRIYFSENLCLQFISALEEYYKIIELMLNAKNKAKYESDGSGFRFPENEGSIDLWKNAENKVKKDIKNLRLELAEEFRKLIGV
tara:strand:+ start:11339 stop:11935 length:597 start_codon:yes stop_codon:yes gene_type:complete